MHFSKNTIKLRLRFFNAYPDCELHTLIHTLPIETKLHYLGLSSENAEFLAPLLSSQHLVMRFLGGKCKLRDVISTLISLNLTHPNAPPMTSLLLDLLGVALVRFGLNAGCMEVLLLCYVEFFLQKSFIMGICRKTSA